MNTSNINRYEIFLKVAELGNITRAAEALSYTQSGISHAIAALEKEAGATLFIRNSSGVTLTSDGQRLIEPVQNLVNMQRNLAQAISEINHVIEGTIRIGTFTSVSAELIPHIITVFNESYPKVSFELYDGTYDEIEEWILNGKVDCGFLTTPVSDGIVFRPICEDQMLVLLSRKHQLAEKDRLTIEEICNEPFITLATASNKDIKIILGDKFDSLKVRYELKDDISVFALVENNFGISIGGDMLMNNHLAFDLAMIPFEPAKYRTIGIASRPLKQISVITRTFIQFLENLNL